MLDFKVRPEAGDSYEVTADSRDVYVWEKRQKKGKTFQQLMNDLAMADMYDIAYLASKREGLFDGTFDEFARTCVIEMDQDEEPDPTQAGASDEP